MSTSEIFAVLFILLLVGCSDSNSTNAEGLKIFSNTVDAYFEALEYENGLNTNSSPTFKMTSEQHLQWVALYKDASDKASHITPNGYFKEVMGDEVISNLNKSIDD